MLHPEVQKIVDDVHMRMHEVWSKEELNEFFLGPYSDHDHLYQYHHGFGTWIRNNYNLWSEDMMRIIDPERAMHPDDLSHMIIVEVWKKGINGEKS